ncbi:MICOS complex subunit MIC27 isoform X2 [Pygocentrus nattereri]|uniref:MICOS complex subunit MIC27 isoform X2 n=1 Tax=Pygocentrus nattereri TaxID=42514 RepID=UPI0008142247|nr:MICOS complex subunit MIC27 isoform X2 [Pygocentrus nattereri]
MSSKVIKVVAVPAVLGFASIRVYAVREAKTERMFSPQELSIYSIEPQKRLQYVEEQPGALQSGLGKVRGSLQSYMQNIKSIFVSAKVTGVNLYHGGEDIYHFLKDPPSGFIPRVAVITLSGLAGMVLARKGSRMKRLVFPFSLATAGFAVCYPIQTISILKVSAKTIYAASHWTSSTVASLWKSPAAVPAIPSPETVAKASTATEEVEASGTEESSQEFPPPTKPSMTPMPEAQAAPVPLSVPVLAQASETEHFVPSAKDELIVADEEKTSSLSSSQTDESKLEMPSVQTTTESKATTEKKIPGVDLKLMDFGQSNPEDADLYSTRS